MTKWFNTNYHYLVPEFYRDQRFKLGWSQLFDEVEEAKALGLPVKAVLLGPSPTCGLARRKRAASPASNCSIACSSSIRRSWRNWPPRGGVGANRRAGAGAGPAGRVAPRLSQGI
jgi:hypothetical protein